MSEQPTARQARATAARAATERAQPVTIVVPASAPTAQRIAASGALVEGETQGRIGREGE